MASEQSTMQAMTQALTEAGKAAIMVVRQKKNLANMARPAPAVKKVV